ncbi:hypothetical protein AXE76_00145 [Gardnerella vaginalis]|uniref:Uncharacterized protein n=1 Tax=Gardnerella vaginalis TaxID=2702 RepID=A0A3E1IPT0_GARVA|nr:Rib/alpha-like domain-containing protein [Gardnerella vaginalis]RFD74678.1 hypothetical protein AXE76_00145 [Gardnerella vaginalis]
MLPAKFRGFASRVGRLASRALAWHKTSERDGAARTSRTVSTSSTAVTSGNVAESTTTRTARPSHTLRRALFAMLVAVATLLAMLILPPVNKAKGVDQSSNTNKSVVTNQSAATSKSVSTNNSSSAADFADADKSTSTNTNQLANTGKATGVGQSTVTNKSAAVTAESKKSDKSADVDKNKSANQSANTDRSAWNYRSEYNFWKKQQSWWGGTGRAYTSGKGFDGGDSLRDIILYKPTVDMSKTIEQDGKKLHEITWTVYFNANSPAIASAESHQPYEGNLQPKDGTGYKKQPILMAWLPKGLVDVKIRRDRLGNRKILRDGKYITYGCWTDEANCSVVGHLGGKTGHHDWQNPWDFNSISNENAKNGTDRFNKYWYEAFTKRVGDCNDGRGHTMCEVNNWKDKFEQVVASLEYANGSSYRWIIKGYFDGDEKTAGLMPFAAGWNSDCGKQDIHYTSFGDDEGKGNYRSKWVFMGPFDLDGDGIPDYVERFVLHTDPNKPNSINYPKFDWDESKAGISASTMLADYATKRDGGTAHGTLYGGTNNVPITTYGESPITIKPYIETGTWNKSDPSYFAQADEGGSFGEVTGSTTDLPNTLPGANGSTLKVHYAFVSAEDEKKYNIKNNIPKDIKRGDLGKCDVKKDQGCITIDKDNGYVTYNPRKTDVGREVPFDVIITHVNPKNYPYNCNKDANIELANSNIKILSQASQYNPVYDEVKTTHDKSIDTNNQPESRKNTKNRYNNAIKVTKDFPTGTKFEMPSGSSHKDKKYIINGKTVGDPTLDWSKILKDSSGVVRFTPDKTNAGEHAKTPVIVTYPDGSTSENPDAGNMVYEDQNGKKFSKLIPESSVVYAKVYVEGLDSEDMSLTLNLSSGRGMHSMYIKDKNDKDVNDRILSGGYDHDYYKKLKKETAIDDDKKIILDSWSNGAKGKIDFRAICHKKDSKEYKLLKPPSGKSKPSGDINGLQLTAIHQWNRASKEQESKCTKDGNCGKDEFEYNYLTSSQYNRDTMERSRAIFTGTPKEGGDYECRILAFRNSSNASGNSSLKEFDKKTVNEQLYNAYGSISSKSTGNVSVAKQDFAFHVDVPDNQKYNPTYVKIPEIKAGTFANKETNSSDQPKSTKDGNGVPQDERDGIVADTLPKGTWFEIKRFVKAADITNSKVKSLPWANFEGGEDNVKRDEHGNPVKKDNKIQPNDTSSVREYGAVTFRPDKWQDAGEYWAEVRVHYPDGSVSDGEHSVNEHHPVYAKVTVTRDDANNQFGLKLYKDYPNTSMGNGYDLKVDKSLPNDATFDSWMTKSVGPIHLHMICSKKTKDGTKTKQTEYTYNRLPGHDETDGLRLKKQTIWGHATFDQQKSCIKDRKACKPDTLLYDDWVPGGNSNNTSERTRGFFGGKAQKTGDYECKVYAIKGDQKKSDAFKKAVEDKLKSNKNEDPVPSVLNASGNPYGTEGVGYKTGSFAVRIHNDNQLYNPTYTTIPEIEAGSAYDKNLKKGNKALISSDAPQSKKKVTEGSTEVNANGVPDYDLQNVKEGALPAGTWYEIKRFVKAGDISKTSAKSLPWANFEDGEDNKADDKQEAKDSNATGKGSVTFRPDKWQDADDYWAEIRVHYPDGSVSDSEDSINYKHPIYAKVKVTRPTIDKGDLHLNVYKQYENGKFTGYVDDVNGITVMKGVGLLKDMGIDSWSTAKPEGITLRALCRDDSDEAKKSTTHIWSENLDNLFFKLNWQKSWDHADFQKQEACRKGSNNGDGCNPEGKYLLFDSTGGTMERASGTITSDKAPTKSGKYYCVVLAMKLTDLGKYKKAIKNSKISVTNNNFAKAMGFTDTEGIDWTAKYFPVTVVEKFSLPKTGGEGMSMALLVVAMIGMCVMCGAFFVDQTKWGHAMLVGAAGAAVGMMGGLRFATQNSNSNRNSKISEIWRSLVKKVKDIRRFDEYSASAKDFVRKVTGWVRAAFRRVRRWATERWRC